VREERALDLADLVVGQRAKVGAADDGSECRGQRLNVDGGPVA
jgi:hypothetical protein